MSGAQQWNLIVKTPFGDQSMTLNFQADANGCSGTLTNRSGTANLDKASFEGRTAIFTTTLPTPMGNIRAEFNGNISGDLMTGFVQTSFGNASFSGTRA